MREVEDIDLKQQIVTVSPGFRPRPIQLKSDYLAIALGNITDLRGMPGLVDQRNAVSDSRRRRSPAECLPPSSRGSRRRGQSRTALPAADICGRRWGLSGVEVMAELNDFVHAV